METSAIADIILDGKAPKSDEKTIVVCETYYTHTDRIGGNISLTDVETLKAMKKTVADNFKKDSIFYAAIEQNERG